MLIEKTSRDATVSFCLSREMKRDGKKWSGVAGFHTQVRIVSAQFCFLRRVC
jgi:hypothetical protein